MLWQCISFIVLPLVAAREISFPPVAGYQNPVGQASLSQGLEDEALDISSALYSGLTTYANLPYIHCLADGEVERYDIAIVGAPFDTVRTDPMSRSKMGILTDSMQHRRE